MAVSGPAHLDVELDEGLRSAIDDAQAAGATPVVVLRDGAPIGVIVVSDTVKPGAAEAISRMKKAGLRPVLLTGDNAGAARHVAGIVGIGTVISDVPVSYTHLTLPTKRIV